MTFEESERISFIITMIAIIGLLVGTCYVRIRRKLEDLRFAKQEEEARLILLAEEKEEDGDSSPRPLVPSESEVEKASKITVFDLFFPKTGRMELSEGRRQETHLSGSEKSAPHRPA